MKSLARSGKYANDSQMYALNGALNLIRSACGTNATVIQLDDSGVRLNAHCYPFSAQTLPPDFQQIEIPKNIVNTPVNM
jgi:hypothetical protein